MKQRFTAVSMQIQQHIQFLLRTESSTHSLQQERSGSRQIHGLLQLLVGFEKMVLCRPSIFTRQPEYNDGSVTQPTNSTRSAVDQPWDDESQNELQLLLKRASGGDQTAFEHIYSRTSKQLFGVLLRILKSSTVAEDALQESYIKIWNNAASYQLELGKPMTWMISIARYHALDVLRKRKNREDREITSLPDAMFEQTTYLDASADSDASAEILTICLDKLDKRSRDCIVKSYCEGYSHDELSTAMASPLGSVKSWIRRGLLALRECVHEFS